MTSKKIKSEMTVEEKRAYNLQRTIKRSARELMRQNPALKYTQARRMVIAAEEAKRN